MMYFVTINLWNFSLHTVTQFGDCRMGMEKQSFNNWKSLSSIMKRLCMKISINLADFWQTESPRWPQVPPVWRNSIPLWFLRSGTFSYISSEKAQYNCRRNIEIYYYSQLGMVPLWKKYYFWLTFDHVVKAWYWLTTEWTCSYNCSTNKITSLRVLPRNLIKYT